MEQLSQIDPKVAVIAVAAVVGVLALALFLARGSRSASDAVATTSGRGLVGLLARIFPGRRTLDPELRAELRTVLLQADVGTKMADQLLDRLGTAEVDADSVAEKLAELLAEQLAGSGRQLDSIKRGGVIVIIGINGSGKTTGIAKIAARLKERGDTIVLGAADTFRAAAAEQLQTWGERLDIRVVRQSAGADPAAVAFDAISAGQAGDATVIIDTAGRIHGDQGLLNELEKIIRVCGKARDGAPDDIFLTLDASQGQAAQDQARTFARIAQVTGLIINKIDGQAAAGFLVPVVSELQIPIIAVGTGETINDLAEFDPERLSRRIVFGEPYA